MEKLKKFLKSIGIEADMITKMVAEEQDFDPAAVSKTVKGVIRESLKNDEDFISEMDNDVRGRVLSSKENKLVKMAGITKEELEALPKERRFDAMMELALEKVKGTGASDDALKKEVERLREKVQSQATELETSKGDLETAKKSVSKEREAMGIERDIYAQMAGKKLIIGAEEATELSINRLRRDFDLGRKDGKTVMFKKGTELVATDPETERPYDLNTYLDAHIKERKWEQVSNGAAGGERHRTRDEGKERPAGPGAPKKQFRGAEAAQAAADARAAARSSRS